MERSIIHYNYGTLFQGRQELFCKPKCKKRTIHGAAILKWGKKLITHFSGNNTATLILSTTDSSAYLLASRCVPVFPIQVCIYAAFIHIGNLIWRYILDFFLIRCYFFRILFPVACCFFYVLSYTVQAHHECHFRCIQMLWPFPIDMRPGVPPHTLSAFQDRSFESRGAVPSFLRKR